MVHNTSPTLTLSEFLYNPVSNWDFYTSSSSSVKCDAPYSASALPSPPVSSPLSPPPSTLFHMAPSNLHLLRLLPKDPQQMLLTGGRAPTFLCVRSYSFVSTSWALSVWLCSTYATASTMGQPCSGSNGSVTDDGRHFLETRGAEIARRMSNRICFKSSDFYISWTRSFNSSLYICCNMLVDPCSPWVLHNPMGNINTRDIISLIS